MRGLIEPGTHDLFQKKLRDRALRKEPNFRWCAHVSIEGLMVYVLERGRKKGREEEWGGRRE